MQNIPDEGLVSRIREKKPYDSKLRQTTQKNGQKYEQTSHRRYTNG